jgi:hypothetical protein
MRRERKLEMLKTKAERLGELIGQSLTIGTSEEGRRLLYRVERADDQVPAGFSPAYSPAQELWDKMAYAESAVNLLRLVQKESGKQIEPNYLN